MNFFANSRSAVTVSSLTLHRRFSARSASEVIDVDVEVDVEPDDSSAVSNFGLGGMRR